MNEIEKRRHNLLAQTRNLYHDKFAPPAIHPRFQTTYRSLYGKDETKKQKYSWLRVILSLVLMLFIYVIYQQKIVIGKINYETIIKIIKEDLFGEIFPLLIERFKFF